MNYQEAKEIFSKARNAEHGKPIANNTRLMQRGRDFAIQLHATDILTFRPDGAVIYNTGGWRTVTTKERMNRYGPLSIWSQRGQWLAVSRNEYGREPVPYRDGMRVSRDGRITGTANKRDVEFERKLRKDIGRFAREYVAALYAGEISAPGPGDCWICAIAAASGAEHRDRSHIVSHIDEQYYVPRLIWDALDTGGYGDGYKYEVAVLQKLPGSEGGKPNGGFIRDQLTRAVRKYCLKQCGMAA